MYIVSCFLLSKYLACEVTRLRSVTYRQILTQICIALLHINQNVSWFPGLGIPRIVHRKYDRLTPLRYRESFVHGLLQVWLQKQKVSPCPRVWSLVFAAVRVKLSCGCAPRSMLGTENRTLSLTCVHVPMNTKAESAGGKSSYFCSWTTGLLLVSRISCPTGGICLQPEPTAGRPVTADLTQIPVLQMINEKARPMASYAEPIHN